MAFTEIDIRKYCEESPLSLIGDQWALLSAGDENGWNTMTVSWGQVGVLWNKNVATVYVRPQRHTLKFVEENEFFTLSFFPPEQKAALSFCGSHSGRDFDKAKETGLTPVFGANSVSFREAKLVLTCRKLYRQPMLPECFLDSAVKQSCYPAEDYHICFIGEITAAMKQENGAE